MTGLKMSDTFTYTITTNPNDIEDVSVSYNFADDNINPLNAKYCDQMGVALANMLANEGELYAKYLKQVMQQVAQARLKALKEMEQRDNGSVH
jgi:hypothetical protein